MTYEVQQTRWDRLIRRVSGSIGPGSRVSETISELFPVIDVERVPGELLLLSGTHLCHGGAGVTGAAGELPNLILSNPAGSGNIITITQIAVSNNAIDEIRFALSEGAPGAQVNTERFREGRLITPTTLPVGQVRTLSNPSQLAQQVAFVTLSNEVHFISDENGVAVLAPGTNFSVGGTTVATVLTGTFWWRERAAQPSELQF